MSTPLLRAFVRTPLSYSSSAASAAPLRFFSKRAMSAVPLTFAKYPFLKNLGLAEHNHGVFDGKFQAGKGAEVFTSVNPATNEKIATITTGSLEQLEVRHTQHQQTHTINH
jgi:hypothetical protein